MIVDDFVVVIGMPIATPTPTRYHTIIILSIEASKPHKPLVVYIAN